MSKTIFAGSLEELFDTVMKSEDAYAVNFEIEVSRMGQKEPERYVVSRMIVGGGSIEYSARRVEKKR